MKQSVLPALLLSALAFLTATHSAFGDSIAQQAYFKASNTGTTDAFGFSVSVSGDTMVIGAPYEDSNATGVNGDQTNNSAPDSGAAYVFVRNGTNWTQQAYLKASNTGSDDQFGCSVAISGNTVVIGAWRESSDATGVNGDGNNNRAYRSGAAYVFVRDGTNWAQQAYLKASNTGGTLPDGLEQADYFGLSVAVSGDTIVVGATGEDSAATGVNGDQTDNSASFSGAAYVFRRSGTNWTQEGYLKSNNSSPFQFFGVAVAVDQDTVVVGTEDDEIVNNSGGAHVFRRSGTTWSEEAYLKVPFPGDNAFFGNAVAVWADTVVVGAPGESSGTIGINGDQSDTSAPSSGATFVFVREGTTWNLQAYLKASNTESGDRFGDSVAVDANTVMVGSPYEDSGAIQVNGNEDDNSAANSGAAYVFKRDGTNWWQQAYLKASNTGANDVFGSAVALSGDTVVAAAPGESSDATGVNGDQGNNNAARAGAAFVFTNQTPQPLVTIARFDQLVTLSWPVGATNYVLEAATSLPAVSWTTVTNTPTVTATNRSVQLPLTGPAQFFRLRRP